MNCDRLLELLHDGVDGELAPALAEELREHLQGCAACARQMESARRVKRLVQLRARKEPPPAALENRLRATLALEAVSSPARAPGTRLFTPRRSAALAALVLCCSVVLFVVFRGSEGVARIAHGQMVRDVVELSCTHENPAPREPMADLDKYLRDSFHVVTNPQALAANNLHVKRWDKLEIDGGRVPAVRMQCELNGTTVTCFVIKGQVVPGANKIPKEKRDPPLETPTGRICHCAETVDGYSVYCLRPRNIEKDDPDMVRIALVVPQPIAAKLLELCPCLHEIVMR